jgi:hypothetical protein
VLRLSNCRFLRRANAPSSVVHTGVKSFGCEKKYQPVVADVIVQWIGPSVESRVKSGAISPNCRLMEISVNGCSGSCRVGQIAWDSRVVWRVANQLAEPVRGIGQRGHFTQYHDGGRANDMVFGKCR